MSAEPLVSVPSVGTHTATESIVVHIYHCNVSVTNNEVQTEFSRDDQIWIDPVTIPWGDITKIKFTLLTAGYQFKNFDLHSRDQFVGPFELGFGDDAPQSQVDAGFSFPPVLRVRITPDSDPPSAEMTVTNRYHHLEDYKYSLQVTVVPKNNPGQSLTSDDPTLIEEAYEPPGEDCERRPRRLRSCGSVLSSRNQGRLNQRG